MITRDEYLKDNNNLFHSFYGQFVNNKVQAKVLNKWDIDTLKKAYKNDIPSN